MADDVSVKFGAQIDQLVAGLKQSSDAIQSWANGAKSAVEGLTAPFEKFQSILLTVGSIAAGGYLFKDIVDTTTGLTSEVVKLQKSMGITLDQANQLGASLKFLGIDTSDYTGLALRLDRQIRQNNEALRQMGFTARDLDLGQKGLMDKAIAKLLEYKEGVDRNIAAQVLFGRNVSEVFSLLKLGLEGVPEKAQQLHEALGLTVTEDDKRRAREYKLAMSELSMTFDGIKKSIGDAVLPYLSRFADWFASQGPAIIANMKTIVANVIEFSLDLVGSLIAFARSTASAFQSVIDKLKTTYQVVKAIAVVTALIVPGLQGLAVGKIAGGLFGDSLSDAALAKTEDGLDGVRKVIQDIKAALAKPIEGLQFGGLPKGTKSASDLLNNRDSIGASMEFYQTQIKLADEAFRQVQEKLSSQVKTFEITEDQKSRILLNELAKRHAAETAALADEARIQGLTVAQQQKITDQRLLIDAKYAADRQRIMDEARVRDVAQWNSVLSTIQGAWDSQLRGLLAGTTTWSEALKSIFADLVLDIIKQLEKILLEKIAIKAVDIIGGGPLSFISGLLPSFDAGAYSVPGDMTANIHKDEMIIPAGPADAFRSLLGGGGGQGGGGPTIQINGPVIGTQAWINQMIPQIAKALQTHGSRTPSYGW
jgi:hypothetical protein